MLQVPEINDERGIICIWNILDSQKPEQLVLISKILTYITFI